MGGYGDSVGSVGCIVGYFREIKEKIGLQTIVPAAVSRRRAPRNVEIDLGIGNSGGFKRPENAGA